MILSSLSNNNVLKSIIALIVMAPAASTYAQGEAEPALKSYHSDGILSELMRERDSLFTLIPYETNYLLFTHANSINKESIEAYDWADNAQKAEIKFQISIGFPIWHNDKYIVGASYTQRSWWQAFNHKESSSFRETNYEPQLFFGGLLNWQLGNWTIRDFEVGFNHQSNGRGEPTSRSWNRGYARVSAVNGNWMVDIKPWFRFNESSDKDDNPQMTKYMGYYRAKVAYRLGENVFSMNGHYNWSSGYVGAEVGWSYPITRHVRLYTQVFSGYGESMIDHDHKQKLRVGLGFMLNDLL